MNSDLLFTVVENDSSAPTIDLHEIRFVTDAIEELDRALARFLVSEKYCRVIYGIGEGILSAAVAEHLDKSPIVREWRAENSGGSAIVLF